MQVSRSQTEGQAPKVPAYLTLQLAPIFPWILIIPAQSSFNNIQERKGKWEVAFVHNHEKYVTSRWLKSVEFVMALATSLCSFASMMVIREVYEGMVSRYFCGILCYRAKIGHEPVSI